MRKILISFLFISFVFFSNCGNKKDYKEHIIGKWDLTSQSPQIVDTSDELITSQIKKDLSYDVKINDRIILEFYKNGNCLYIIESAEDSDKIASKFNIEKETLTIENKFGIINYEIVSLNSKELKIIENITDDYAEAYKILNQNVEISKVTVLMTYIKSE